MPKNFYERRKAAKMKDPEFKAAFVKAEAEIASVVSVLQGIEHERTRQGLSKERLAELAGLPSTSVRRLLTQPNSNPGLATAAALAHPLGMKISLVPMVATKQKPLKKDLVVARR